MNGYDLQHVLAACSDIKVILGAVGGAIVVTMQIVTFVSTHKDILSNTKRLNALTHAVDEDIREQIEVLKRQNLEIQKTTKHLEGLIERRQSQTPGHPARRSADQPMRKPIVAPDIHDPKLELH